MHTKPEKEPERSVILKLNSRIALTSVFLITLNLISIPVQAAPKVPTRIISLSPSATEDLFALGVGKFVIAVDDNSNFPPEAPTSKLSSFNPNVEAIAKYKPDLVIIQNTASKAESVAAQLKALKIAVYLEKTPVDLDGVYKEISDLGTLTGKQLKARIINNTIKVGRITAIARAKKSVPINFFHEIDNTLYSATSSTFIGKVYADFNLKNIADGAAKADDAGYPQLQNEYVISQNPKIIFLADAQYGESAKKVLVRTGWNNISAVKNLNIVELPADIPSRWGPRIVDFYRIVADEISSIN